MSVIVHAGNKLHTTSAIYLSGRFYLSSLGRCWVTLNRLQGPLVFTC